MKQKKTIYLDNAATSEPKPKAVLKAVETALRKITASPGRSGYQMAHTADRFVYDCRKRAAAFFGLEDASRLIYTPGGTYSINVAINGFLKKGDHIISTGRQHNAVTRALDSFGINSTELAWNEDQPLTEKLFQKVMNKKTKAVIVNHASNVDGLLYPLKKIGRIAKKLKLALIVDAAQTAGLVKIDMKKMNIDMLCVTAHKGLLGPAGIGILALSKNCGLKPTISGGTGSVSEGTKMPADYPDRLEAGSMNLGGIAGLDAGIREIQKIGRMEILKAKTKLTEKTCRALSKIEKIKIYRPKKKENRIPLFLFNIEGIDPSELGDMLDRKYGIACRVGLHCAPSAHREIGTYPEGGVRFAPGYKTTITEINLFVKAITEIAEKKSKEKR